ncbi:PLS2 scramblase, partial [Acromyrmex heyeri]
MTDQKYYAPYPPLSRVGLQPPQPIATAPPQPGASILPPGKRADVSLKIQAVLQHALRKPTRLHLDTSARWTCEALNRKTHDAHDDFTTVFIQMTKIFFSQVLEVYSGNTLLGSVTQEWSLWRPKFYVRDASGQPVLMIKGPLIRFCIDVIFKVKSMDEKHRVGMIRKHWSGFAREMFTVSDMFGIHFPRDLDVKIKAVLLGACILIVGIVKIL